MKGGSSSESAERVAMQLTDFLLQQGAFENIGPSEGIQPVSGELTAVISRNEVPVVAGLVVRGVGASDVDEEGTERPTCYVYVSRGPRNAEKALPTEIRDVRICIRKVMRLQVKPELAASAIGVGNSYRSKGKIACGSSIGLAGESSAGTLGALVKRGSQLYCLSNNHVIGGCNHTPIGHPILAPSTIDARADTPPVMQFAKFEKLEELRSGHVRHVPAQLLDAAIASVANPSMVSSMQGTFFDTPTHVRLPKAGERVKKVGRTTGLTYGIVESRIPQLLNIPYRSRKFSADVNFSGVWVIRSENDDPIALPGDSGSLFVAGEGINAAAVGLLFAASSDGARAFAVPIVDLLSRFDVTLTSGAR